MPTPNGVNYLLQSLLLLSNSPIVEQQESKVDVHPICPYVYFMLPYALICNSLINLGKELLMAQIHDKYKQKIEKKRRIREKFGN